MAKRCQLTGKSVMSGNNVSHANNRTFAGFAKFAGSSMLAKFWTVGELACLNKRDAHS